MAECPSSPHSLKIADFFKKDFIYLFEREKAHMHTQEQGLQVGGGAEGEKHSLMSREPDAEQDPRT